MARAPAEPTQTVSVCVTPTEQAAIRQAATAASLSVSAWASATLVAAMASNQGRTNIRRAIDKMNAAPLPRGARACRVSAVLRLHDYQSMKDTAATLRVKAHAMVQATLIEAATVELSRLSPAQRRHAESDAAQAYPAEATVVMVPEDMGETDPAALTHYLSAMCDATAAQILDGKGRTISAGVTAFAERYAGKTMVGIRVGLPDFEFRAPAHVLDVPASAYASALAAKACRKIKEKAA